MMTEDETVELQVFVEAGCQLCDRARLLSGAVDSDYPALAVRVIDIGDTPAHDDAVFAVPTFVLNGRLLSLGNPQNSHLRQEIETLLRQRGLV